MKPQFHEDWSKMAAQQDESRGKKSAIKHVFFSKRGQDFVLLKQVPESSHQTNYLAGTNMLGH